MTILLIGCGRMGGAMARGWVGGRRVLVHDPLAADVPGGIERVASLDDVAVDGPLSIVLAIKPQAFDAVAGALRPLAARGALFLSIMAGITIGRLEAGLGTGRIVRAMPNTPAAIGRGISAAVPGPALHADDRATVDALLAPAGAVVWLDQEALIDAVTAVSGSGPAYFFRFTEALAAAGTAAGLPAPLAMELARATFTGAAALADADRSPLAVLREQVTSPGGTTAAGLAQMNAGDAVDLLLSAVVDAAAARSRELAG